MNNYELNNKINEDTENYYNCINSEDDNINEQKIVISDIKKSRSVNERIKVIKNKIEEQNMKNY